MLAKKASMKAPHTQRGSLIISYLSFTVEVKMLESWPYLTILHYENIEYKKIGQRCSVNTDDGLDARSWTKVEQ